jgi:hypothetical protein
MYSRSSELGESEIKMAQSRSKSPVILSGLALGVLILTFAISGPEGCGTAYFRCGILQGCDLPGTPRSGMAYALEGTFGYEAGKSVAHILDITPFTVSFALLVVAGVTSSHGRKGMAMDHALTELNRCDGCKTMFHSFSGLSKVEGKGFLCEKCRSNLPETPKSEA